MKVDFSRELTDLDNKPILTPEQKPFTLGKACVDALMVGYEDEKGLSGEEKLKRYDLALAIHSAKNSLEIAAEQVVLLKKLVGKGYGPLVSGQVWKMLESS
jgi:hypothetical protein